MDEEIERLIVAVRADTRGFSRDVAEMRGMVEGPLGQGAERAGRAIEASLARAVRTGKFGFEDLKRTALSAMAQIASSAVSAGVGSLFGGSSIGSLVGAVLGLPGRATGGPVAPGRAYVVGERGAEMFVPTSAGRVEPVVRGGVRDVRVVVNVSGGARDAPEVLARSGRQVARAVRAALNGVD